MSAHRRRTPCRTPIKACRILGGIASTTSCLSPSGAARPCMAACGKPWEPFSMSWHVRRHAGSLADGHARELDYSVLDLKADYRGYKYVEETIKMLPEKPEPVLLAKILNQVAGLGRIHAT